MKVMVCDANYDKAKVLTDLLNVYRFKLITLTDSADFFKQVQMHKPAIIILNEKFASKPGHDMISRIRANPSSAHIPIIFISENGELESNPGTYATDSLVEMMREPFKIKHLRHCIDRWTTFRSLHIKQ